jgi:hypothetical protein
MSKNEKSYRVQHMLLTKSQVQSNLFSIVIFGAYISILLLNYHIFQTNIMYLIKNLNQFYNYDIIVKTELNSVNNGIIS